MALSLKNCALYLHLLVLLAVCSACDDPASQIDDVSQINQAESLVTPKMVVQLGHQKPVVAIQWINDGENLVSLGGDGAIMFWDVKTGVIVDHAQVPTNEDPDDLKYLWFQDFRLDDDRKTIAISYYSPGYDRGQDVCPKASMGDKGWCGFRIDIETRTVTSEGTMRQPDTVTRFGREDDTLNFPLSPDGRLRAATFSNWRRDPDVTIAEADRPQPEERECDTIDLCNYPLHLVSIDSSQAPVVLQGNARSLVYDIDVSADGRRLVKLQAVNSFNETRVEALDLSNGAAQSPYDLDRHYGQVWALDDDRYAVTSEGDLPRSSDEYGILDNPPTIVVDPDCARRGGCRQIESYEQMRPFDGAGNFLGVGKRQLFYSNPGLAPAFPDVCPPDASNGTDCAANDPYLKKLSLNFADEGQSEGNWTLLDQPEWKDQEVTGYKLSPDRSRLAVATQQMDDSGPVITARFRVWMFDVVGRDLQPSPRELFRIDYAEPEDVSVIAYQIGEMDFTPNGERIIFTQIEDLSGKFSNLYVIDIANPEDRKIYRNFSRFAMAVADDRIFGTSEQELLDTESGKIIARDLGKVTIIKNGTIARSDLFWSATVEGSVEFRDSHDGSLQLTLYLFPDNRFFAVTPGGRYDTNLGADTNLIRWLVPDAPWQSLGPQTFMRDFYEPGLYGKVLDCRAAANCDQVFKRLDSVASLNRVLPRVTITGVKPGKNASEAIVSIEVEQGVNPSAANGKTRSGIYNPRLFRNGRVVAMTPDRPDAITDTPEKWRALNDVSDKRDPSAPKRYDFTVPLPTGAGTERQEFSAYAFNEDRIKSETATFTYDRPPIAARQPKAFVVAIGIDEYDTPRFRLNYAVADARLIAQRLADIPGYDMRRLTLAGERKADGSSARIDNTTIMRVLSLIMTNDGRTEGLKALRDEEGIDASMLEEATPDDIVIISFSGHGWADKQGNFYLIPTNGYWDEGSETPELRSVFATADLAMYFRAMQAAEITFIIDACHSAASVASGQFKPGPMGDSGLGQLAYDKGIRILAATQSDDVALEDARLKQGLLTYALAGEGLTQTGGKADLDGDRRIRLDEWLDYAVDRLPSLSEDVRVGQLTPAAGNGARAIVFNDLPQNAPKRRVQKPSLFDFNTTPSPVILRKDVR